VASSRANARSEGRNATGVACHAMSRWRNSAERDSCLSFLPLMASFRIPRLSHRSSTVNFAVRSEVRYLTYNRPLFEDAGFFAIQPQITNLAPLFD